MTHTRSENIGRASTSNSDEDKMLLAPYFLLRVTGLPLNALDQLQCPQTVALIEEILTLETTLEQAKETLLERISVCESPLLDRILRHSYLDLRRAIMHLHGRRARKVLLSLSANVPPELMSDLEQWCAAATRRMELLEAGEATLQKELTICRQHLQQMMRNEDFQSGLLLSSPTLYSELQYYLMAPADKSNNRLRKAEAGLLSYFIRMATKPSPYSSFASTALGLWTSDSAAPAQLTLANWNKQHTVRFHDPTLRAILRTLSQRPEIWPFLHPRVNPTLRWLEDKTSENAQSKIEFLRIEQKSFRKQQYREEIARLRPSPLNQRLLQRIAGENLTCQEIIDATVNEYLTSSNTDAPAQRNMLEQKISENLHTLAKKGVIEIDLGMPTHEYDTLGWLVKRLQDIPGPWVAHIREVFLSLQSLMADYTVASSAQRYTYLRTLHQQVESLCHYIGATELAEEIPRTFPSLILEDTLFSPQELVLSQKIWQPLFNDLSLLRRLAPLCEAETIQRIVDTSLLMAHGPTDDAFPMNIVDYHLLLSKVRNQARLSPQDSQKLFWQLKQIKLLKEDLIAMVRSKLHQAHAQGHRSIDLEPDKIRCFTQSFPAFLHHPRPLAYFGQGFLEAGQAQMVVNSAWPAPGTAFSRFSYQLSTLQNGREKMLADLVHTYIADLEEKYNVRYSSLTESGNLNVNIRNRLTSREIVFPQNISLHPGEEQYSLRDIQVRKQNTQTQMLQLFDADGTARIEPLHMGFSLLSFLPPLYRTMSATTVSYPGFDMLAFVEAELETGAKEESRHYPRINLGHAVLNRETWIIPRRFLPRRETDDTSFTFFLKMNRWRMAMGLPLDGFRRILSLPHERALAQRLEIDRILKGEQSATSAPVNEISFEDPQEKPQAKSEDPQEKPQAKPEQKQGRSRLNTVAHKPFFVHFHNYFLLSFLEEAMRAIPEGQALMIEEMLPSRSQSLLHQQNDEYSTEFILELD